MYPFTQEPLQTMTNLVTNAGARINTPVHGDTFTYWFWLTLTLVFTIAAGPATAVRGNGSPWQAFDFVAFSENGTDMANVDPRVLFYIGQRIAQSQTTENRQVSLANGTYTLRSTIPLLLANPMTLNPGETAYRESNPKGQTFVAAQFSNNAAANLFTLGAATCTFNNALTQIEVEQFHNPNQKTLPLFRPFLRQSITPVPGANPQLPIMLFSNRYLGLVTFMQDTNVGAVTDIASQLQLLSDVRGYIAPAFMTVTALQRITQYSSGGEVFVDPAFSHFGVDFRQHGQLTTMPHPNETNLRALINAVVSLSGTSSTIRTTFWEYERPTTTFQGPNGQPRLVVAPTLPAYWPSA